MIVALSGGIGGAKLALGLARVLAPDELLVIVNTADDFEHLGLHISPDLDTVMYTLAGCNNPDTGWGMGDETWNFMENLARLGGPDWFRLGDRDLATHVLRTRMLRDGATLTEATQHLCARLGIAQAVLPMCDQPVATVVETAEGLLPFQEYFVRRRCRPRVTGIRFDGVAAALPNAAAESALRDGRATGVVVCPSNPLISIDPILAVPGFRSLIRDCAAPVVAVSPLIGGKAFKGPTAKMMTDLGKAAAPSAVAARYADFIDGFVLDHADSGLIPDVEQLGVNCRATQIGMDSLDDRIGLARQTLALLEELQ
jgi:LPPG:FO 2-phospho-L-lactate transferase